MSPEAPSTWTAVRRSDLALPGDAAPRLLLLLPDVFNSTVGSFGALGCTPWGGRFLEATGASYHAVLGFDDATLTITPLDSANHLLALLRDLDCAAPPQLDIVAHGRGGLVFRSLVEYILPDVNWPVRMGRVVFIGVPNGGMQLASPSRWADLLDLYTNLAAAACRSLDSMNPASATTVLTGMRRDVGPVVAHLALPEPRRPSLDGLAAMAPDSAFIRELNLEQVGQPTSDKTYYCVVTSEFDVNTPPDRLPRELPPGVIQALAAQRHSDGGGVANDLLVETASMSAIDPEVGMFVRDRFDFGRNSHVYHTNYVIRPEVVQALAKWLRLTDFGRGIPYVASTNLVEVGATVSPEWPAIVDTDIVVAHTTESVRRVRRKIVKSEPAYVVLQHDGDRQRYVLLAEDFLGRTHDVDQRSVRAAMDLDSLELPRQVRLEDVASPSSEEIGSASEAPRRALVVDNDAPVGVVQQLSDIGDSEQLADTARRLTEDILTENPYRSIEPSLARRVMLTLRRPVAGSSPPPPPPARGRRRTPPQPATVRCHLQAECDDVLVVGRVANFEVTIAREVLRPSPSRDTVSDRAAQDLDPRRAIVLEAIAKTNFEIVGQSRYALRVPARNERQTSYFDVRPTHEGPAELWILVRQSGEQLLTLRLSPRVVASRASGAKRLLVPADVIEPPPTASPPINELLIVEQRNGAKASYAYYLNFINPELNNTYRSELEMEPAEYVSRLYKEIESKVIENRADERKLADAMRAFGSGLFDKLFPEPLQRQLWIHRNHIKSVQVVAEEPFIPWELVHLKEPNGRLGKQYYFLAQLGLVRWLKNVPAHTPRLRGRSGRLRYEIPNYEHPDLVLEELAAEAEFLREQLGATAVPARYSTVLSLLKQPGKFDVLHFAGHSEANADNVSGASLLLEGGKTLPEDGFDPERLQASIIEQFANLRGKDDVRPLVVINGCQSGRSERQLTGIGGFAKAFLKAGAGAFVGTLWTISDVPSRHFTEAFYSGLQAGQSITVATVNAREVARAAGDATWLAYVVYAHPWATLGAGA